MNYYLFNIDESKQVVELKIIGYINKDILNNVENEYREIHKNTIVQNYLLIIDMFELVLLSSEAIKTVSEIFRSFQQGRYKFCIIIEPNSIIASYQIKRVVNDISFMAMTIKDRKETCDPVNGNMHKPWVNYI